jgi:acyl carrier protein phosphodiesterase
VNFLAHLYLSGDDGKRITGNFIGDFVKGKNFLQYPGKIREGIILHRLIDTFTDNHHRFREVKKLFRPEFRHYSGVVTDLAFDHILAADWQRYSPLSLPEYIDQVHAMLLSNFSYMPSRVQHFLPVLIKNRRLESYSRTEGIRHSLQAMSQHTSLPDKTDQAMDILQQNFDLIAAQFAPFMKELVNYVEKETTIRIKRPQNWHL